jgi:hypothetical protein
MPENLEHPDFCWLFRGSCINNESLSSNTVDWAFSDGNNSLFWESLEFFNTNDGFLAISLESEIKILPDFLFYSAC